MYILLLEPLFLKKISISALHCCSSDHENVIQHYNVNSLEIDKISFGKHTIVNWIANTN